MIFLLFIFLFQIFLGGAVSYDFLHDMEASAFQDRPVIQAPMVRFPNSQPFAQFGVEMARTPSQRERGLMFRRSLPENRGMLFVFDDDAPRSFWMKNTLIPLDMVFVDAGGAIVSVSQNVRPCAEVLRLTKAKTCPTYSSVYPARYVLEVNAGVAQSYHIQAGSYMDIHIP